MNSRVDSWGSFFNPEKLTKWDYLTKDLYSGKRQKNFYLGAQMSLQKSDI